MKPPSVRETPRKTPGRRCSGCPHRLSDLKDHVETPEPSITPQEIAITMSTREETGGDHPQRNSDQEQSNIAQDAEMSLPPSYSSTKTSKNGSVPENRQLSGDLSTTIEDASSKTIEVAEHGSPFKSTKDSSNMPVCTFCHKVVDNPFRLETITLTPTFSLIASTAPNSATTPPVDSTKIKICSFCGGDLETFQSLDSAIARSGSGHGLPASEVGSEELGVWTKFVNDVLKTCPPDNSHCSPPTKKLKPSFHSVTEEEPGHS